MVHDHLLARGQVARSSPWNRYPAQVSSKKRSSGRRKAHRQGLSGNPQRRAGQLARDRRAGRDLSVFRHPQADRDRAAFRELAYRFAGGALPEPWWRESHERILARARALTWPARLVDLETQACQIVGDEFYDRLRSRVTGLHPAQWLRALAEETGAALRAALAEGADDWQRLWALLCGLTLAAPRTPAGAVEDLIREYYRLRRRARDLTGSADPAAGSSRFDAGHAPDAFLDWYATRHDDVPAAVAEATATIYEEWGSHEYPDERSFYACSPPYRDGGTPDPRVLLCRPCQSGAAAAAGVDAVVHRRNRTRR